MFVYIVKNSKKKKGKREDPIDLWGSFRVSTMFKFGGNQYKTRGVK